MSDERPTYLFEYEYDGETWVFEVKAEHDREARARVYAMSESVFLGKLEGRFDAPRGAHLSVVSVEKPA